MTLEDAVYQLLSADSGVSSLVSTRIFSGQMPQKPRSDDPYPAIVYRVVDRNEEETLDAPLALVEELVDVFSVSSVNSGEASRLDRAVIDALAGYRGDVSDGLSPESTITIQRIFTGTPAHRQVDPTVTDPVGKYQFHSRFRIHYVDPLRT